jgi:hypothetical protein
MKENAGKGIISFLSKTADRTLHYSNEDQSDSIYLLEVRVVYFQLIEISRSICENWLRTCDFIRFQHAKQILTLKLFRKH